MIWDKTNETLYCAEYCESDIKKKNMSHNLTTSIHIFQLMSALQTWNVYYSRRSQGLQPILWQVWNGNWIDVWELGSTRGIATVRTAEVLLKKKSHVNESPEFMLHFTSGFLHVPVRWLTSPVKSDNSSQQHRNWCQNIVMFCHSEKKTFVMHCRNVPWPTEIFV